MINSMNNEYTIISDAEVANMIEYFDRDLINTMILQSLNIRVTNFPRFMPNYAIGYESYFKEQIKNYPDLSNEFRFKSDDIYSDIIRILSNFYKLDVMYEDNTPLSSKAIHMYDLLISQFQMNIIKFFVNYIICEVNGLYDQLELSQYKKSKDSTTIYNKKVWKFNNKLALISANLELVIDNICQFDISFENFINIVYKDNRYIGDYLLSFLAPRVDYFKEYITCWFNINSEFRIPLITEIRLSLMDLIPRKES